MKKIMVSVLVIMITLVLSMPVFAVGPGKSIELKDGAQGMVTFSGDAHKMHKCNECHPALFKMKKGADKMTMKEMQEGKFCGKCHDGKKAFDVKGDCIKCHKKK